MDTHQLWLVLVASLAGSVHCAGMCGVFVAFAVGADKPDTPRRWLLNGSYHLGRLVTYTLLGAICGAIGIAIDRGGTLVGLHRFAAIMAGVIIVLFGLVGIARVLGVSVKKSSFPPAVQRAIAWVMRMAMKLEPAPRALVIGLLTTLLPCGWLWAFAVVAAGTADPLMGAAVMAAFWLGTVPILAGLGLGVGSLMRVIKPRLAMVMSIAIVCLGVWTIFSRMEMSAMAHDGAHDPAAHHDHGAPAIPTTPPCCDPDEH